MLSSLPVGPSSTLTAVLVCAAYLVGAVPFGLVVVRLATGRDIRAEGSGNIGATNVFRTVGPALGVAVLLLDLIKGAVPVVVAQRLGAPPGVTALAGLAAIIGHNWSVFLRGKGGKGVATSAGVLLALSPVTGLVAASIWVTVVGATHLASAASLLAVSSVPVVMLVRREPDAHFALGIAIVVFAFYQHRANIGRLMRGEELPIARRRG